MLRGEHTRGGNASALCSKTAMQNPQYRPPPANYGAPPPSYMQQPPPPMQQQAPKPAPEAAGAQGGDWKASLALPARDERYRCGPARWRVVLYVWPASCIFRRRGRSTAISLWPAPFLCVC